VVQLSLKQGLEAEIPLALERAIAPLRDEAVLIVGSGLSYHYLRQFFSPRGWGPSRAFDAWLNGVPLGDNPRDPDKLLARREAAPAARAVHPRDEHLLPLHVAVGAAGDDAAELTYHENDFLGGLTVSSHRFRTAA
jgi:aromatic ring-opening dioxygenase catalytic subunit (LigB family)